MNQPVSPFSQTKSALVANRYAVARSNLLLVILFTLINVALAIGGGNYYLLFSASIPYGIAGFTAAWARSPEQIDMEPASNPTMVLVIGAVIAVLLLVPYLLCWIFSKKHYGWIIAALVLFSLDTLWLLMNFNIGLLLDILFHGYVLFYLIMGTRNGILAKRAGQAEAAAAPVPSDTLHVNADGTTAPDGTDEAVQAGVPDSPVLRSASDVHGEKVKVYATATYNGHQIQYRRIGKNTEDLVVDDQVYAEMPRARVAGAHMTAIVAGTKLEAGVINSRNLITVNDQVVASTVRYI